MKNIFVQRLILLSAASMISFSAAAEKEGESCPDSRRLTTLFVETRIAGQGECLEGDKVADNSGFKGQWLNFRIDGQLAKGLTFSYRQRLNKNSDRTFFDATDWIHLDWQASERWTLSGGKQVVAIGGYEYDRAPIDLYYCSEFWGNIPCYQLGISAAYRFMKNDQLMLQLCNSPFRTWCGNDTYAWNLYWSGSHGFWETLWSVNLLQYTRSSWINYLAFGNNFRLGRGWNLNLDVLNRAAAHQTYLMKDCSVMAELNWRPSEAMRYYVKYTYDVNHSGTDADQLVLDSTEINELSFGCEGMPLRSSRDAVRLFASFAYGWGSNTNLDAPYIQNKQLQVQLGFKMKVDLKTR